MKITARLFFKADFSAYLEKAIVLCVDEKPSIQALERAQGYLKLPNGRALTGQRGILGLLFTHYARLTRNS